MHLHTQTLFGAKKSQPDSRYFLCGFLSLTHFLCHTAFSSHVPRSHFVCHPPSQGLYCDIRQLVQFIKEAHGNVFRRVALSALLDSAEKVTAAKKPEEKDETKHPGPRRYWPISGQNWSKLLFVLPHHKQMKFTKNVSIPLCP